MKKKDNTSNLEKILELFQKKEITSSHEVPKLLNKELEETKNYDDDLTELLLGFELEINKIPRNQYF